MNRAEKILMTLFELSSGEERAVSYEDLVVAAFKKYPDDFSLRGYPEFPDASDIHKPIYTQLKPRGFVRVSQKTFVLTDAGIEMASRLSNPKSSTEKRGRLTRTETQVLSRLMASEAVKLVLEGRNDDLIDTDSQRFYGFASWSKPRDAAARRSEFLRLLEKLSDSDVDEEVVGVLRKMDEILTGKFGHLVGEVPDDH